MKILAQIDIVGDNDHVLYVCETALITGLESGGKNIGECIILIIILIRPIMYSVPWCTINQNRHRSRRCRLHRFQSHRCLQMNPMQDPVSSSCSRALPLASLQP